MVAGEQIEMKFHHSSGEDYYDSFRPENKEKSDGELLKKIRGIIDSFVKNGGDFRDSQSREVLVIIIAEEVEEHYSDIP